MQFFRSTATVVLFGATITVASTVQAAQVGTIGSAKNNVSVNGRSVAAGSPVSSGDAVRTGGGSATQIVMKDRATLTLGANSAARPSNRSRGSSTVNIAKGAFRFISGAARPTSYKIKTPVASIGIRGSIIEGFIDSATRWEVIVVVQGRIEICTALACKAVNAPGSYIRVMPDGRLIGPAVWRGPYFDLDASINFVRSELRILLEPDERTDPIEAPPPTAPAPAPATPSVGPAAAPPAADVEGL